jgi:subtilisin family serine protease
MKNKLILVAIGLLMAQEVFSQAGCNNPVSINDPMYNQMIYNGIYPRSVLDSTFAFCAWSITKGDPDIIVGVIDTEFDTTHEDMENTFESVVGPRVRDDNHGTGVSSLVASGTNNRKGMAGIGYNTRVRGYHVGGGNDDKVWYRVRQAYGAGIKIINVSFLTLDGYNDRDSTELKNMLNDGLVLTLGAGNSSGDTVSHKKYANFPGIINVSCVNRNNHHDSTNTARNTWVDVCAPSSHIIVAVNSKDTGAPKEPTCEGSAKTGWYCLAAASGFSAYTSYAAPQVAGVVALMRSVNSFLSSADIEKIIKETGDKIPDDSLFKGRTATNPPPKRVNAYEAVKEAKRRACGTTNTFSKAINTNNINESVNGGNVIISNTTVASGKRLSVRACNSITITGTFSADAGAMLNINIVP